MKILIIGIGNVLMGDDAVGPYVIKMIESMFTFAQNLSIIEAGTPGCDLPSLLCGFQRVIAIDSVRGKEKPGSVVLYEKEQLMGTITSETFSSHEIGFRGALLALELSGELPNNVTLVGVHVDNIDAHVGLSQNVAAALPLVIDKVLKVLDDAEIPYKRKTVPDKADIWWEAN